MGAQESDPDGQNYDPQTGGNEGPVHEVALSPVQRSQGDKRW